MYALPDTYDVPTHSRQEPPLGVEICQCTNMNSTTNQPTSCVSCSLVAFALLKYPICYFCLEPATTDTGSTASLARQHRPWTTASAQAQQCDRHSCRLGARVQAAEADGVGGGHAHGAADDVAQRHRQQIVQEEGRPRHRGAQHDTLRMRRVQRQGMKHDVVAIGFFQRTIAGEQLSSPCGEGVRRDRRA